MQHPLTDRRCEGSATTKVVTAQSRNRTRANGRVEAARLYLTRLMTVATIGIVLPIAPLLHSIPSSLVIATQCPSVAEIL